MTTRSHLTPNIAQFGVFFFFAFFLRVFLTPVSESESSDSVSSFAASLKALCSDANVWKVVMTTSYPCRVFAAAYQPYNHLEIRLTDIWFEKGHDEWSLSIDLMSSWFGLLMPTAPSLLTERQCCRQPWEVSTSCVTYSVPPLYPALISAGVATPSTILARVCTVLPNPISCLSVMVGRDRDRWIESAVSCVETHICKDAAIFPSGFPAPHPLDSSNLVRHEPDALYKAFDHIIPILKASVFRLPFSNGTAEELSHVSFGVAMVTLVILGSKVDIEIEPFSFYPIVLFPIFVDHRRDGERMCSRAYSGEGLLLGHPGGPSSVVGGTT